MQYFGVSAYVAVPVAILLLFGVTASGSFKRWERFMMLFVVINVLVVPLLFITKPHVSAVAQHLVLPGIRGGASSTAVLLIISIIGTTVAPWQLFFQQSNIVDKKISPRWLNYERVDTIFGAFVVVIGASALVAVCAAGFSGHGDTASFSNALGVARGLNHSVGHGAGALFSLILLNASIIGATCVTLASSYAINDLSGSSKGLDVPFSEARGFYLGFAALLLVAGIVTLIPGAPLALITLAVQAICGLMLPSTTIIVLLLCNDREVMGPWVNSKWLNVVAIVIITSLVVISFTMMISTLFTSVDVVGLLEALAVVAGIGLAVGLPIGLRRVEPPRTYEIDRRDWRTPRLTLLAPMATSKPRRILMRGQSGYLLVAGVVLLVRFIQLATK
jgi:Mn2+/Fe2+ NRAMP family transporter